MAHIPSRRKLALMVAAVFGAAWQPADAVAIGPRGPSDWRGLPITFERNDGQHEAPVVFTSRGPHGVLALRAGEILLLPRNGNEIAVPAKLKLAGANPSPEIASLQPLVTRSHYYTGNAQVTNIPHFAELRMKDVYPGIDVDLHGRTGTLEYDFVVAPGADPRDIRLDLRDAKGARIDGEGNLVLDFDGQTLVQRSLVAYQDIDGERRYVAAEFKLADGEARIALGDYDHGAPLTVDPVIAYSSYVGSSGNDTYAIARANTTGIYFVTRQYDGGNYDVVASKLDPATNTLIYETHFGGGGYTLPTAAVLGASGTADDDFYIAGYTDAPDFPLTPATPGNTDAFVVGLGPGGTIQHAALIGGSGADWAYAMAVDAGGAVYIAGSTNSPDLPVTTGLPFNRGSVLGTCSPPYCTDGFVAKLSSTLVPQYVRYLGGSGDDILNSVAVDPSGQAVVAGWTTSNNLPPAPAFGPQIAPTGTRAFAAKLGADGSSLLYCEYVGGSSAYASGVAVDPITLDAFVGGVIANASLFPASTRPYGGGVDGFIVRLRSDGVPTYGTYVGGSGDDFLHEMTIDEQGAVYVTGGTLSMDFPQVAPIAGLPPPTGGRDVFVARLRDAVLDFSTRINGNDSEEAGTISANGGTVYISGYTYSTDFPVVTPLRATRSGASDGFVTKITGLDDIRSEFVGDFNGDGRADVVWQHKDGSVAIWLMAGDTLAGGGTIRAGGTGWKVAFIGDFNGDGKADILWTHPDGSAQIWLMNGTTQIGQATIRGPGTGWRPIHVADFNFDGKADILWQHRNGSTEMWTMNGMLGTPTLLRGPGTGWTARLVGDFNGDGRADILWRKEDGSVTIWLMNGATLIAGGPLLAAGNAWIPTHVGDFDGDGKADILMRHANGSTVMYLMDGATPKTMGTLTGPGSGIRATHVGDLNGDGKDDIVFRGRYGSLAWWMMDGTRLIQDQQMTNTTARWVPRRIGNFGGDHRGGIVLYDRGTTRVWFVNPDGTQRVVEWRASGSPWTPVGFDE